MSLNQLQRPPDFRPLGFVIAEGRLKDNVGSSVGPLQLGCEHNVKLENKFLN